MNPYEVLIPITAIVLGGMTILIPVAGLTARYALKPIMEAIAQIRGTQGADQRVAFLEQRLALLEEQFHAVSREHQRLVDESDFRKQLESPQL